MDIELIKHYAYELHGHLPEEKQQEAVVDKQKLYKGMSLLNTF
mgnify:CR=1 FL=1